MKPYPPTMREKRRYILFKLECEGNPDKNTVVYEILKTVYDHIGVLGAAEASFYVINYEETAKQGVLRATNESLDRIIGVLGLLQKVNNKKARIHILSVTGTIKKTKSLIKK